MAVLGPENGQGETEAHLLPHQSLTLSRNPGHLKMKSFTSDCLSKKKTQILLVTNHNHILLSYNNKLTLVWTIKAVQFLPTQKFFQEHRETGQYKFIKRLREQNPQTVEDRTFSRSDGILRSLVHQ